MRLGVQCNHSPIRGKGKAMKKSYKNSIRIIFALLAVSVGMISVCLAEEINYEMVQGDIGPGAHYEFYVPDAWNGMVVYYAHGYQSPELPPSIDPVALELLKNMLLPKGYAFAASSYSMSGWSIKEGIQQTHQLSGLFASRFGKPIRSYLMGHSMGGLITMALAEKFGHQYDGALCICSPVGGGMMGLGHYNHARVIFDYFYPGVLPGNAMEIPAGLDFNQVTTDIITAIILNPTAVFSMASIDQLDISYNSFDELLWTIYYRIIMNLVVTEDALYRAHDHVFFNNSGTYYTSAVLTEAEISDLNAAVARFTATPDAANFYDRYYEPSGDLQIPLLTLHNTRDMIVPIDHEDVFDDIVNSAGSGDFLVRKEVDAFGHCVFTDDQQRIAFEELENWVENGQKPADGLIP